MSVAVFPGVVEWHDAECGSYTRDLPLWRELAAGAAGPVLDCGCGTGRVALDLASAGHDVCGVDRDPALLAALDDRARTAAVGVETALADLRDLDLGRRFALAIVPMQTFQLLGGAEGRARALRALLAHLDGGALLAVALADPGEGLERGEALDCTPDVTVAGGWRLESTPVALRRVEGGTAIDRRRLALGPRGEWRAEDDSIVLEDLDPAKLEREAGAAGFRAAGRRRIPATDLHVGSEVVLLEAG